MPQVREYLCDRVDYPYRRSPDFERENRSSGDHIVTRMTAGSFDSARGDMTGKAIGNGNAVDLGVDDSHHGKKTRSCLNFGSRS